MLQKIHIVKTAKLDFITKVARNMRGNNRKLDTK